MLTVEQAREEASKFLENFETPSRGIAMRSCWNCNSSHEHLRNADDCVIWCFECGHYFFKGVKLSDDDD